MRIYVSALVAIFAFTACQAQSPKSSVPDSTIQKTVKPMVTFVELGSVNCIPCKKMQPVMKSIEARYGEQIKVIFYDVWRSENKQYAVEYRVQAIPTQVFLDSKGNEFFRHMGFYDEESIDKLLQSKGLKPKPSTSE